MKKINSISGNQPTELELGFNIHQFYSECLNTARIILLESVCECFENLLNNLSNINNSEFFEGLLKKSLFNVTNIIWGFNGQLLIFWWKIFGNLLTMNLFVLIF